MTCTYSKIVKQYDTNKDGTINASEALAAQLDANSGLLTSNQLAEVLNYWKNFCVHVYPVTKLNCIDYNGKLYGLWTLSPTPGITQQRVRIYHNGKLEREVFVPPEQRDMLYIMDKGTYNLHIVAVVGTKMSVDTVSNSVNAPVVCSSKEVLCPAGTITETQPGVDANGCPYPNKCREIALPKPPTTTTPKTCPQLNIKSCPTGYELLLETNSDGCRVQVCSPLESPPEIATPGTTTDVPPAADIPPTETPGATVVETVCVGQMNTIYQYSNVKRRQMYISGQL